MSYFVYVGNYIFQKVGANDVDGFVDYSHKEILPLCFIIPLDQEFDLNEAQSYLVIITFDYNVITYNVQCLGEIAGVIKALIHSGVRHLLDNDLIFA